MIEVKRGIAAARGAEVRMSAAAREPKGRMAVASEAQSDAPRNATG